MTAGEKHELLYDGQASGTESLLEEPRRRPHVGQALVVIATLALTCTALAVCWQSSRSAAQLPAHDILSNRVFLSEVATDEAGPDKVDATANSSNAESDKKESISADNVAKPKVSAAAAAKALQAAEQLNNKAADLKGQADNLKKKAKDVDANTESLKKQVSDAEKHAREDRDNAKKARSTAEESRGEADALLKEAAQNAKDSQAEAEKRATELLEEARKEVDAMTAEANQKASDLGTKAEGLDKKAAGLDNDAIEKDGSAASDTAKAETLAAKSQKMKSLAAEDKKDAADTEKQARKDIAAQRMCINLPGVKLQGNNQASFDPVVGKHEIKDDWQCSDWCQKHAECKQSIFTWETKTCELFKEATDQPLMFRERWPWFNSSYCDAVDQKQNMLDMVTSVFDQKPWVPPLHNCSFGSESCLHTKCCADVCDASWDFKTCEWFTCWKRDENWAGCKTGGAPANWDGTKLGGHPNSEIPPAADGKLIQGTKLYCFSVVMWNSQPEEGWQDSEGMIANHWKEQNKGIMQCDDYSMFDGYEGGSVHNIQSFVNAWKLVKDDGRWKQNDWTIKVDPDAVFFPDHFRKKVEWVYKTPQGATVYFRNTFYKFQFLGALEVLTREATEVLLDRIWECEERLGQQGGEDYWLLQCLEGLGVDFQTDVALLHDKYAADENCGDPNGVAHHFFKKIEGGDGWDNCWNTANDAWNNEHPE